MDNRDTLRDERLTRVDIFGDDNHADWPATSATATRFASIKTIRQAIAKALLDQGRLPVGKSTVLDALWADFINITRTARAIARDLPGFAAPYLLPGDDTERAIKLHADALLNLLEDNLKPVADGGDTPEQLATKAALRQRFIDYFLPVDFVAHLRADRDLLDQKNKDKISGNDEGNQATGEIEVQLQKGNDEVAHITAALQNLYARDPAKLRSWLAASKVERSPKKKKDGGTNNINSSGPATPGTNP